MDLRVPVERHRPENRANDVAARKRRLEPDRRSEITPVVGGLRRRGPVLVAGLQLAGISRLRATSWRACTRRSRGSTRR